VNLKGEGFVPAVKAGDRVRAGDALIRFDGDFVARSARSLLTQIVIANMERVAGLRLHSGRVLAGRDVLMEVALAGAAAIVTHHVGAGGVDVVESAPLVVTAETGLHARPAAVIAAVARRFSSVVQLRKDGREANARSVVSVMALEVGPGDAVTVTATGSDAAAAVEAMTRTITVDIAAGHTPPASAKPSLTGAPVAPSVSPSDGLLRGVAASPGVAIGQVYQLRHDDAVPEERGTDPARERHALETAISAAREQLEVTARRLAIEADPEKAEIFRAHQELLEDPDVIDGATAAIRDGKSAAWAWRQSYGAQAERLLALRNPLLAARATDMRDVGRRVLHLIVGRDAAPPKLPADAIVVAEDLTPSDAASLDRTRVRGLCTTMGSATSHVAILARGLGIPAVAGIDPHVLDLQDGERVVIDGDAGTLRPAPSAADEAEIVRRQAAERERRARDLAAAAEPAQTRDGHRVEVVGNIGDVKEARRIPEVGGEGVGLLRTEFLFMERRSAPDEDEQARTYTEIAQALGPSRVLVIRTLDVGGDKPLAYLPMAAEQNPFLGERGIRLTLARPELFRAQVRAILRASSAPAGARICVMFPMIATLAEWRAGRALVERERAELGTPKLEVGIMVETAAAAMMADRFAEEADFFSIGTNDLTQYTLAMDRGNPRLAPQVDALHPSVLRLIERTVEGAHRHGKWVGVCGGLASDLAAVPVLVGLGVDELSADVPLVPAVKARVRELSRDACRETAQRALAADDGAAVRAIVHERHG
jgi:phosphoenolpyruvate-protein phosphotransferase